MDMNEIRAAWGSEFIEKITNEFADSSDSQVLPKADIKRKIEAVRARNHHPLYLEMLVARLELFMARCIQGIELQQTALDLADMTEQAYEAESTLTDKIVEYLEDSPKRMAKNGANAKDKKLDPVRKYAMSLANEGRYRSRRQAVRAIKTKVIEYANSLDGVSMSVDQAERTIDGWLKNAGYTPSASKQGTSASEHPTPAS